MIVLYLLRRFSYSILLLAGVSMLAFSLTALAPGDYFASLRLDPHIQTVTVDALRSQHGLDHPLPVRYLEWLKSIAKGDWGYSFANDSPAAPILWPRVINTLLLTVTSSLMAWSIAVPIGIWSAGRSSPFRTAFVSASLSGLLALPDIVLALLLLLVAARTGWFPIAGMSSSRLLPTGLFSQTRDFFSHLLLPASCLVLGSLPLLISHTRNAMSHVLQAPFITAARAHGIPHTRLLFRHALPVAANQLISLFGFSLGLLLSSSLVVEPIFNWPGLGSLMLESILARDLFLVLDSALLAAALLVTGNLLADLLLYLTDPRIRYE